MIEKINKISHKSLTIVATIFVLVSMAKVAHAHHSFAMYNLKETIVLTGVVTRVDPAPNHLQIFFAPMNAERKNVERDEDGKPIVWSVEMAGSAAAAREGISVNSFPPGTVFSVGLHPLRNGDPGGSREGAIAKCPTREDGKSIPPEPGKHCDSVEGHEMLGSGGLAEVKSN